MTSEHKWSVQLVDFSEHPACAKESPGPQLSWEAAHTLQYPADWLACLSAEEGGKKVLAARRIINRRSRRAMEKVKE